MNHPLLLLLMTAAGLYVARLWSGDRRAAREAGTRATHALPGATDAPPRATLIALAGAFLLLGAETLGESALGLATQQTHVTWLFGIYSVVAAPIVEEIIFRGYLVVEGRGSRTLWTGVVCASAGFAALHPFLWRWDDAGFALTLNAKGWFSTTAAFANSLWFYVARLAPWNPKRSLLPCFAAHGGKNLGVLVIKHAQGFVAGWF